MGSADAIVVGGGIAGLSAARALARAGVGRVRLFEREPVACTHASGRNAAIFRHLCTPPGDFELAQRSRQLLGEIFGDEAGWLRRTGMWLAAERPETIDPLASLAARHGLAHERASGADLSRAVPSLRGGSARHGLFFADDGVIDIHAVAQALAREAREAGVLSTMGAEVARVERAGDAVVGVRLTGGELVRAAVVVIAAGAWSAELGVGVSAPLPLVPRRRHLAQLEVDAGLEATAPVIWCLGDELYFRAESGGLLASPCDEEPWKAENPPAAVAGLELLATKIARLAPALGGAAVRRAWACLRTFAPDGSAVIGADPRLRGLYWLSGLGGHGMTGGVAAGEVLAAAVTGAPHALSLALSPRRCLAHQSYPAQEECPGETEARGIGP